MSKAKVFTEHVALCFTIEGKIKPYVRMTQASKWTDDAQEYLKSQEAIGYQIKKQMMDAGRDMLPARTPLSAHIYLVEVTVHNHDNDNVLKAILDAAKGIAYPDDRWFDDDHITRKQGPEARADIVFDVYRGG